MIEILDRKYGTWLFCTALVLFLVSFSWFGYSGKLSNLSHYIGYLEIIARIICCVRIGLLCWKYPRYVLFCALILFILYLSSHLSRSSFLLHSAMVVAASKDEDINKILKIFLTIYLFLLFVFPILYVMGWTEDVVKHKCEFVGHSYGFLNPNRLAFLMQMLVFLVILFFRIRRTWIVWLISYCAALLIGWLTLSMTSVIILLLFPLIYYCIKNHPFPTIWFALIPLILTLLSIVFSLYFGPSTGSSTFESRFSIPSLIWEDHGLSLLGQNCGFITAWDAIKRGVEAFYMNNAYLDLFIRHGVITALITLAFFSHYLYRMGRMNNPLSLAMAVCLAISGLMQLFFLYIVLDFLLLYYFQKPCHIKLVDNAK